jgi:predicted outer membrane protein
MYDRLVAAGLVAALAVPAIAQAPAGGTMTAPIPANPTPTQTQPNQALSGGQGGVTPTQQQRLQTPGAPQDTGVAPRQSQNRPEPAAQGMAGQQTGPGDIRHIQDTMALGTVTLQAATFARTKAQHPRVQRFAALEEAEQNTLFEVFRSLADPAATASTNQQAVEATAQNAPQTRGQAAATAPVVAPSGADLMERMSRAQPGPEFDRDFVRLQLDRHNELLRVQETYLASNPQNRAQRAIAMMARTQIREHIAELEGIQKELGQ